MKETRGFRGLAMAGEHGALRDRANDVRQMFVGNMCANMCIFSARINTCFFRVFRSDFGGKLRVGSDFQGPPRLQNEGKSRISGDLKFWIVIVNL
mgnify:CR=1 FL=1